MKTRQNHTQHTVEKLYSSLQHLESQGYPKEYDIRVDDILIIHRTNDTTKFYDYQHHLEIDTKEIVFRLYQGTSRRYDQYTFLLQDTIEEESKLNTAYIQERLEEERGKMRQEFELQTLRETKEKQRKKIKQQQKRIQELESKKQLELAPLMQLITSNMEASSKEDNKKNELHQMLEDYERQYGKKTLHATLGISLTLCEHPHLIQKVKEFITQNIQP